MASKYPKCQFCEESSTGVNWNCKTCDIYLCDPCNIKIHTKLAKLSEHDVFILQHEDNSEGVEHLKRVDLKEIACSTHMDQKCESYCLNCDKSLCSSCLIRSFQCEELSKIYEGKILLLKDIKTQIDECLPFFEEKAADFTKMDDYQVLKHSEIQKKISKRQNEIKDLVSIEGLKLVGVMKEIWDIENNPVSTEHKRLSQIEQELRARKIVIDKAIEEQKPNSIFSIVENISREIPEKSILEIQPPELVYIEPKQQNEKEKLLGSVLRVPKVFLIETFKTNFPNLSKLVSLGDDIYVMHSTTSRKLKYFTISGPKLATTKDIIDENKKGDKENSTTFLDLTKGYDDIFLSDMRRLKDSGIFENLSLSFNTDDLNFHCIHSAYYNQFIVGFTHTSGSAGILELKINKHNDVSLMKRMEWNSREYETLFTLPEKLTSHINDNICVIDRPKSKRARIVVIDKWGQPKWTYNGHRSINSRFSFSPNDIVATSSGLVLVAEKYTNAIHVLSKEGQFICNCLSASGITRPCNICFNKGLLLIGCSEYELYSGKENTTLHTVKFVEQPHC